MPTPAPVAPDDVSGSRDPLPRPPSVGPVSNEPSPPGPRPDDGTGLELTPLHLRPRLVGLVALGGVAGTALRAGIGTLESGAGGWPWATWTVDLSGAFLLGLLLEALARTGPDDGRRRDARLLLGTGALGGYTSYSTLALETVELLDAGDARTAVLYAAGSVVLGLVAAGAGIAVGIRLWHPVDTVHTHHHPDPAPPSRQRRARRVR
jgi:fluoride exporter